MNLRDTRVPAVVGAVLSLSFAVSVFAAHATGQLFPWLPAFVAVSLTLILAAGLIDRLSTSVWICLTVLVGTAYRLFVYLWPPGSTMIGADPDKVAVAVHRVMSSGSTSSISDLAFYSKAPLAHVYAAETGLLTGLSAPDALVVYPLAIGVLAPVGAAVLASRLAETIDLNSPLAAGIAATFAAAGANLLHYSFWPIPQSLAVLLWIGLLITLVRYYRPGSTVNRALFCLFSVGLLFTHKLAVQIAVATVVFSMLIQVSGVFRPPSRSTTDGKRWTLSRFTFAVGPLLIVVSILVVQWVFLTEWVRAVVISALIPLFSPVLGSPLQPLAYTAAVPAAPGLRGLLMHNLNWLLLVPVAGLSAIALWWIDRRQSFESAVLIGAAGALMLLIFLSVVSSRGSIRQRGLFYGEVVLIVLVATAAAGAIDNRIGQSRKYAVGAGVGIVLSVLLVSQVAVVGAITDHPAGPRFYLTGGEIDGKEFANDHISQAVSTDYYYAREVVEFSRPAADYKTGAEVGGYQAITGPLFNASVDELANQPYLALRTDARVHFISGGLYRITWNPELGLDAHPSANRLYAKGDVVIYE